MDREVLILAIFLFLGLCSSRKIDTGVKLEKVGLGTQSFKSMAHKEFDPSKVIQISWHPRLFLYEGFLSADECEHLILQVNNSLGNSTSGSSHATSGMLVAKDQDDIISRIESRISLWTFLPKENGEDIRLFHHGSNESSKGILDNELKAHDSNSLATIVMYLSNVTSGGETIFPKSEVKDIQAKDDSWSKCAANSYAVKPVRGNAVLLFNLHVDATSDESSLLGSCKVLEGEKWTATKVIHTRPFNPITKPTASMTNADCTDEDESCPHWAALGECQRNPVYMLGNADYYGTCRKSCGVC